MKCISYTCFHLDLSHDSVKATNPWRCFHCKHSAVAHWAERQYHCNGWRLKPSDLKSTVSEQDVSCVLIMRSLCARHWFVCLWMYSLALVPSILLSNTIFLCRRLNQKHNDSLCSARQTRLTYILVWNVYHFIVTLLLTHTRMKSWVCTWVNTNWNELLQLQMGFCSVAVFCSVGGGREWFFL
jgi:hypothetical protein